MENEVELRSSEYINTISNRIQKYPGLLGRFNEASERELRKKSFPAIIEGIPLKGVKMELTRLWEQNRKRWSLVELINQLEKTMFTFGAFELRMREAAKTELQSKRDQKRTKATTRHAKTLETAHV